MNTVERARARIYDAAIVSMTAAWYRAVLARLPLGCRLLDVGIGTGGALLANRALLEARRIRVTGVDIDAAYVEHCRREVANAGFADRIEARLESVYDHRGGPYDAAYFSASFMLLPDPPAALRHVASLLAPAGSVWFTQTFEHRRSRAVELFKPLLRHLTTVDFGRVTYEREFRDALAAAGFAVDAWEILSAGRRRSAVLVHAGAGGRGSADGGIAAL